MLPLLVLACRGPSEICDNGVDDDGNGRVDCDQRSCARSCDADRDGHRALSRGGRDCNDDDPEVFPGAPERCNGVDDDCDGLVDDADDQVTDGVQMWVDRDGDGFGDDGRSLLRCAVGAAVAEVAGDCDDLDPAVHPGAPAELCDGADTDCDGSLPADEVDADGDGAPLCADCDDTDPARYDAAVEVCDGIDNDCDGSLPADEVDADGDGDPVCSDCDDADPSRSSRHQERCSGQDDDCDGLVDEADDSVNPYTCGYCPDPDSEAASDLVPYLTEAWNPCVLDPTTEVLCSTDPKRPDTHTDGQRLHYVTWRTDEGVWRDELLVFLPPGPGNHNRVLLSWAAFAGYRAVGLGFPNDDVLTPTCSADPDPDGCWLDARTETLYGTDTSPHVAVGPQDSIEGRLRTLLGHLAVEHPEMGFERHLAADGTVDWSTIVLMGWSFGGGQAAFTSKLEAVRGVISLSSPKDHQEPDPIPVDWTSMPGLTPGCAMYASWHVEEPYSVPPADLLNTAWDNLGIPATTLDLDLQPGVPPAGTHRISQSYPTSELGPGCDGHASTGNDRCMRDEQHPAYLYMLCAAAEGGSCTP